MIARILRSASSPGSCPSSFSGTIFCPPGSILRALSAAQPTAPAICPLASRGKTLSALEWTDYNLRLRKNKSPDGEVGRGLTIFEINTKVPSRRPVWPAPVIDGHYGHIQIFLEAPRREMELSCVCRAQKGQHPGPRWEVEPGPGS